MAEPLVSIVTPVLNGRKYLEEYVRSVLDQSYRHIEQVFVDGGSTDGTLEIIQRYRDRIAILRTGPDGGPTNAINEGVRRASGEIICLLPADDWLEPGALSVVAEEFSNNTRLEILTGGARIARVRDNGEVVVRAKYQDLRALEFTLSNILRNPLTCARFIRRAVYERLGGMDSNWIFADKEFLVRAYLAGVVSKVRCELVFTFRQHAGSTTNSGRREMTMKMLSDNIKLFRHYGATPALSIADRRAFRHLHGGSSARLAISLVLCGRFGDAWRTVQDAFLSNSTWPLNAVVWYYESAREKYRHARAR